MEPTPILPPPNVNNIEGENGSESGGDTAQLPTLEPGQIERATATSASLSAGAGETTGEPTPTLELTTTLSPTPAATPVTNPPIQAVNSGQMPPASRDLLFLADGAFKRWNHNSGQIETLLPGPIPGARIRDENEPFDDFVGDITQFSVSEDGKRAVVVRLTASETVTRTVPDAESLFTEKEQKQELWFMDLVSNESWLILPRVDNLRSVALSPNGQHVAFTASSLDGNFKIGEDGSPQPRVYFLATGGGNPGPVVQVADCAGFCFSLAWHPDNNIFVWHDQNAVWLRNISGDEPELLLENRTFNVHVNNPSEAVVYSPIEWASNGRYLLLWKGGWEGGSRAVFDVPTAVVAEIPGTFVYVDLFPTEVMWMPDDRLYVLKNGSGGEQLNPMAEIWRFHPEQNNIVLEESVRLATENVGAAGQQYLDDGRFAYVLFAEEENINTAGMYHLTSFNEVPERVNAVPPVQFFPGAGGATWSSDGFGAIILPAGGQQPRIYYGSANGDFLYDITNMLGAEPHAYHWQPEIIIP